MARPIGELALGPALQDLLAVVRRHRLQLPSDLALLAKTLATAESSASLAVLLLGYGARGTSRWFGAAFVGVLVLAALLAGLIGRSLFRSA